MLALASLLSLGAYFGWDWLREDARPVSITDAAKRFHRAHGETAAAGEPLQPAEGVYEYRGKGSDRISFPPMTQSHGPGMPGTVTQGADGCWTFRIDYSSNHWQDWTFCSSEGGLTERSGRTFQRWDLGVSSIENQSEFTCTSPTLVAGMRPGDRWRQRCTGGNDAISGTTVSSGPMRFLGIESVQVGDTRVDAYHLVQRRDVSGGQRGTLHADLWLAPDGLPVRVRHSLSVATSSPIGDIDYDESTDFSLVSLEPRR